MILGFHYHSAFKRVNNHIMVPGYIGVFIDALAKECEELVLFLEEQTDKGSSLEDYKISSTNIKLVSLGNRTPFYHRVLKPQAKIKIIKDNLDKIDAILLRVPSPLGPHIHKKLSSKIPVYELVVGDYVKGLKDMKQPPIRKIAIQTLTYYYQFLHNKMISKSRIFVNSVELEHEYTKIAKEIRLVKTTTLSSDDFYKREDTCLNNKIKLLYTGRINFQKGLRELLHAIAALKSSYDLELNIVGWEDGGEFNYEEALKDLANQLGIGERLFFHGKKQIGPELNAFYRSSDIYVIPSYHEGFPRTIWEAMASSLPVIATTVGSIPHYLTHKKEAILIEPKSSESLRKAIETMVVDSDLRRALIKNAFEYAQEVTLEKQTKILIKGIKEFLIVDQNNQA